VLHREALESWEVFLIGEPELLSYGELQDRIGELVHGRQWPTLRIPAPIARAGAWIKERAPGGGDEFIKPWMVDLADAHYPVSIERAKHRLGWEPRHRLAQTLPEMIENMQRDPQRFDELNALPGANDG
jgi:nucleoside-diphosphate-sugar epimerase